MSAGIYHVSATAECPHKGQISTVSSNTRAKVSGLAVATMADNFTLLGCVYPYPGSPKPSPCDKVQWSTPAMRVRVMGNPVLLATSSGICRSAEGAPQGPPRVTATQPRVKGT